jgi:hypothetical protein
MNDFLEKNLEDIIFENLPHLPELGFPRLCEKTYRQFVIPGSSQRIDIISFTDCGDTVKCKIFELKKGELNMDAGVQLASYCIDMRVLLSAKYKNVIIEPYLVGTSYHRHLWFTIACGLSINLVTYSYGIEGIRFYQSERKPSTIKSLMNNPDDYLELEKGLMAS